MPKRCHVQCDMPFATERQIPAGQPHCPAQPHRLSSRSIRAAFGLASSTKTTMSTSRIYLRQIACIRNLDTSAFAICLSEPENASAIPQVQDTEDPCPPAALAVVFALERTCPSEQLRRTRIVFVVTLFPFRSVFFANRLVREDRAKVGFPLQLADSLRAKLAPVSRRHSQLSHRTPA